MAQIVKLKRSAVAGNVPTTSSLELGELAINTIDGRIFFEKSSSDGYEVKHIITSDSQTTGSLELTGNISENINLLLKNSNKFCRFTVPFVVITKGSHIPNFCREKSH